VAPHRAVAVDPAADGGAVVPTAAGDVALAPLALPHQAMQHAAKLRHPSPPVRRLNSRRHMVLQYVVLARWAGISTPQLAHLIMGGAVRQGVQSVGGLPVAVASCQMKMPSHFWQRRARFGCSMTGSSAGWRFSDRRS